MTDVRNLRLRPVDGALVRDLGDEMLVFRAEHADATLLHSDIAEWWRSLDGAPAGIPADASDEQIAAIRELVARGLLEPVGGSRRDFLSRSALVAGGVTVGSGLIGSIIVPAAAAAATSHQTYDIGADFANYASSHHGANDVASGTSRFRYYSGVAYTAGNANSPATYTQMTRYHYRGGTTVPVATFNKTGGTTSTAITGRPYAGLTSLTTNPAVRFMDNATGNQATGAGVAAAFIAAQTHNVSGSVSFKTASSGSARVALYSAAGTLIAGPVLISSTGTSSAVLTIPSTPATAGMTALYIVVYPPTPTATSSQTAAVNVTSAIVN